MTDYNPDFRDIDPGIHRYVNFMGKECDKDGVPLANKWAKAGTIKYGDFFISQEEVDPPKPNVYQEIQKKALQNYLDEEDRKMDKFLNHCTKCGRSSLAVVISPKGICTHCITAEATSQKICQWPGVCGEIAKFGEYCYAHMLLDQHAERKELVPEERPVSKIKTKSMITFTTTQGFTVEELSNFVEAVTRDGEGWASTITLSFIPTKGLGGRVFQSDEGEFTFTVEVDSD